MIWCFGYQLIYEFSEFYEIKKLYWMSFRASVTGIKPAPFQAARNIIRRDVYCQL